MVLKSPRVVAHLDILEMAKLRLRRISNGSRMIVEVDENGRVIPEVDENGMFKNNPEIVRGQNQNEDNGFNKKWEPKRRFPYHSL